MAAEFRLELVEKLVMDWPNEESRLTERLTTLALLRPSLVLTTA